MSRSISSILPQGKRQPRVPGRSNLVSASLSPTQLSCSWQQLSAEREGTVFMLYLSKLLGPSLILCTQRDRVLCSMYPKQTAWPHSFLCFGNWGEQKAMRIQTTHVRHSAFLSQARKARVVTGISLSNPCAQSARHSLCLPEL